MVVSLAAKVRINSEKAVGWPKLWPFSWRLNSPLDLIESGQAGNNGSRARLGIWTTVNIVSTVAIIFTNKSIFVNESFGNCQIAFASFHFFITGFTLWMASRPWCGVFAAKRVPVHETLHLAVLMCLQVILQNLSLAYSSVIFHQLVRLLLTPLTALLNYLLYRATIPRASIIPLIVLCGGVGTISYYDALPTTDGKVTASSRGAVFAFTGVIASSNERGYTPSGILACLVNLSQFIIIDAVGPVSSTVIGHLKTCIIVGLGWALSDRPISKESLVGILMALTGMTLYV
ncbi:putative solute transporter [Aspergillus thermomutatus]|uniref:GDP-mannose transporter n=1 Tax=Aspergillus thermomutatus TaxID=41047 RepID=A0A397HEM5_ASPTH|nr:uncharacterized protein CDV56_102118 [Aspergillus thermomutatus]RHZ61427.1 hypothetical protein CDV56_102118 [Aspergillus thermomutatus]